MFSREKRQKKKCLKHARQQFGELTAAFAMIFFLDGNLQQLCVFLKLGKSPTNLSIRGGGALFPMTNGLKQRLVWVKLIQENVFFCLLDGDLKCHVLVSNNQSLKLSCTLSLFFQKVSPLRVSQSSNGDFSNNSNCQYFANCYIMKSTTIPYQ